MISSYLGEGVALDDAVGESMGETVTVVVAHYLARVDGGGCGCVHDCGCGPAGRRPQVLTSAIESWGRRSWQAALLAFFPLTIFPWYLHKPSLLFERGASLQGQDNWIGFLMIKLGHSFIIILMQLPSNLARNFDRMLRQIPDRK